MYTYIVHLDHLDHLIKLSIQTQEILILIYHMSMLILFCCYHSKSGHKDRFNVVDNLKKNKTVYFSIICLLVHHRHQEITLTLHQGTGFLKSNVILLEATGKSYMWENQTCG